MFVVSDILFNSVYVCWIVCFRGACDACCSDGRDVNQLLVDVEPATAGHPAAADIAALPILQIAQLFPTIVMTHGGDG